MTNQRQQKKIVKQAKKLQARKSSVNRIKAPATPAKRVRNFKKTELDTKGDNQVD